jgi:hypothetical protein
LEGAQRSCKIRRRGADVEDGKIKGGEEEEDGDTR